MKNHFDVAIVGGSVAGCILALSYARQNLRVAVLEQKDSNSAYKALCTHFIQPIALPVFQELGLDGPLEELGAVRTKAAFWTHAGWIDPPQDYGTDSATAHAYNIERRLLDPFLRARLALHENIELRMGHRITRLEREGQDWQVETQTSQGPVRIQSRLLVAADGRHSQVATLLGNKPEYDENQRVALFGYFEGIEAPAKNRSIFILSEPDRGFLYPLCDNRTLLALYVTKATADQWRSEPASIEGNILAYFREFPDMPDFSRSRLASPIMGYSDYPNLARKAAMDGAAFVGDAALSLDPLSGVGCGFATVSSDMLAKATGNALAGGRDLTESLKAYEAEFNKLFLPHARGIKADSLVTKSADMASQTYRHITASVALQREFVDLTGRIISPARFQASYVSAMVKARTQAHKSS